MNTSPRAALRSLSLVIALLTAPLCTRAALLAYEGFDYTANTSIAAQAGGTVLNRSAIQITSAGAGGTNFSVTLQGYVGHNYQLEYRNALGIAPWVSVGIPVAGVGAPIILTHPGGSIAQQRFYRVAVNP